MPAWASVAGFEDCVRWLDAPRLPEPGACHRLEVHHPFQVSNQSSFWTLYQPPLSALNGWEDHPEEFEASGIAECRLCEDLGSQGSGRQVRVEVLRAIALRSLSSRFVPTDASSVAPLPIEPTSVLIDTLSWKDFTLRSWSAQSDLGGWWVYMKQGGRVAMILSGSWGPHESAIAAGCRFLSTREASARGLD